MSNNIGMKYPLIFFVILYHSQIAISHQLLALTMLIFGFLFKYPLLQPLPVILIEIYPGMKLSSKYYLHQSTSCIATLVDNSCRPDTVKRAQIDSISN